MNKPTPLSHYLSPESVHADISASSAKAALLQITGLIVKVSPYLDPNALLKAFESRELVQSTGVIEGLAFPQASLPGLERPLLAIARSDSGLPFQSLDGTDTYLFIALVTPEGDEKGALSILARLTRLFHTQPDLYERMIEARSAERLFEVFSSAEVLL